MENDLGIAIRWENIALNNTHNDISGFTLAKGNCLTGDDYFAIEMVDNLSIAIVCDGVGSAQEGAEAASRVCSYLLNSFQNYPKSWTMEKSMKTFVTSINTILYEESMLNYERPELVTTLAMVIIEGERLYGINVGDSRIYISRDEVLTQLSHDHLMEEQGYEGVLTQAIGIEESISPYYFENIIHPKDKILLCSDGLYTVLDSMALAQNIKYGAYALVNKASKIHDNDLPDDTTALCIDILDIDPRVKMKAEKLKIIEYLKEGMDIDGYVLEQSLIQNDRTWLCRKKGMRYVLKFASFEALENPFIFDLFVKEAWNAKRLDADFLPKAHIPLYRSQRYYVMEYIEGIELKAYLENQKLSVEESIALAITLLDMGQYLLKYDLVHGDIKPENIIVESKEAKKSFKMIDFGSMTELYSIDSNAGTPSYLAPERFVGGSINEATEIFAIGVTLYESLCQSFPYGEIEPFQHPHFGQVVPLDKQNETVPKWFSSIILHATAKESTRRYKNYTELKFDLKHPHKVKAYFAKESNVIERDPLFMYRVLFTVSFVLNLFLLVLL
jgi:serine/threonine protein phosphatase PrpC